MKAPVFDLSPEAILVSCCAPITLGGAWGADGEGRSGGATVTFISMTDATYAVTCRHVIESLYREKEETPGIGTSLVALGVHPGALAWEWLFPKPSSPASGYRPDLAVQRVPSPFCDDIGKKPWPVTERDQKIHPPGPATALGFPEVSRDGEKGGCLAVNSLINSIGDIKLTIWGETEQEPPVKTFSGMSGGPVFALLETGPALAGIIRSGSELKDLNKGISALSIKGDTLYGLYPLLREL